MKKLFEDVKELNKLDKASHAERLGKLTEEVGELATEINKITGRKSHSNTNDEIQKEIIQEAADVIQNVFSIVEGFNITYEDIVESMKLKNIKWRSKV